MCDMNGNMTRKLYRAIASSGGDCCANCTVSSEDRQLVIYHKDGNNSNNILDNLQLLCRTCSHFMNQRRSVKNHPTDPSTEESPEIKINRSKEPEFRSFVYEEINHKRSIRKERLINSGAEVVEISPVTAKRYLEKMCSDRGLCRIYHGRVEADPEHPLFKGEIDEYDSMRVEKPIPKPEKEGNEI